MTYGFRASQSWLRSLLVVLLVGLLLPSQVLFAEGYRIRIQSTDLRDTTLILGYYYSQHRYIRDSVRLDGRGRGELRGDTLLPEGMYLIQLPSQRFYDFLLGPEQQVEIALDSLATIETATVKGNRISEDFAHYQRYMFRAQLEGIEIGRLDSIARAKDSVHPERTSEYARARALGDSLQRDLDAYRNRMIAQHPDDLLGHFGRLTSPLVIPEYEPEPGITNIDSARWMFAYRYNLDHYLDGIDFSVPAMIRMPVTHDKLTFYFDKLIVQLPDTINLYVDRVMSRALKNPEAARFYANFFLNKYQLSEIVGMDAVFVHVADNYFLGHRLEWQDTAFLRRLGSRVEEVRPNLIGAVAPEFNVEDIFGRPFRLHALKGKAKAVILVFWEPSCSHCKRLVPALDSVTKPYIQHGLQVIGFMTQGDGPAWQEYLEEHKLFHWNNVWDPYRKSNFHKLYDIYSTPVLYVLDDELRIVLKRIGVEVIPEVLKNFFPDVNV